MIDLASTFKMLCETESDINEHLPTLCAYGRRVDHITEFGVRRGRSTVAWQYANPKTLISYDIEHCDINERLLEETSEADRPDFRFIQADVLAVEIEETDLIFFDTFHSYTQLHQELKLHGNKSRKYLIFHDLVSYGLCGEDGKSPGIGAALDEFLLANSHWVGEFMYTNNNGLVILKRNN